MPPSDDLIGLLRDTLAAQTKMLGDEFAAIRGEMATTRKQVIALVALALILNAAIVGVGVRYGSFSVTPAGVRADSVEPTKPLPDYPLGALDAISSPASATTDGQAVAPVPGYGYAQPEE